LTAILLDKPLSMTINNDKESAENEAISACAAPGRAVRELEEGRERATLFHLQSRTLEDRQGVSVFDQFHLHARMAISGGSARHLGTSLESKLSRLKFTLVLSLPIFSLPVYSVFMPGGAPAEHDVFGISRLTREFRDSEQRYTQKWRSPDSACLYFLASQVCRSFHKHCW
jgi:hypothetical protein